MERLIHQTRTRNIAVNRMLDKYVPIAETRHIQNPDGVAFRASFTCAMYRAKTFQVFSRSVSSLSYRTAAASSKLTGGL
jgi:hypothetical protein